MKIGFFVVWIVAVGVALAFALQPKALEFGIEGSDKVLHLGAFLALTLIPVITFDKLRNIIMGVAFVMAFGVAIEALQHFVPTRSADIMDVAFDALGVALGTMIGVSLRSTYQAFLPRAYIEAYIKPQKA